MPPNWVSSVKGEGDKLKVTVTVIMKEIEFPLRRMLLMNNIIV